MFIDLHCDTASEILYRNKQLMKNNLSIDINKLKKGGAIAQVFAFFIDAGRVNNLFLEYEVMYKNFMNEINKCNKYISVVKNISELELANSQGKIGAFLSIEEGDVLEGSIDNLYRAYEMGVRIITLTWNYKNKIGYPNYNYLYKDKGLTKFGEELVYKMDEMGVIIDVSHLSDKGFYDVMNICKKPIIASHSNARAITKHPRNLDDNMIKLLGEKGGVMGINYCSDFLGKSKVSLIKDMIYHIKHIRNIAGIDAIALGSDFDGIENEVEMKDCSEIYKLGCELKKEQFTEREIEKIFYGNVKRLFSEVLR